MEPVDVLLIEGWKGGAHKKIEVHRPALRRPLLATDDPQIVAIAADAPVPGCGRPVLPLNDESAIVDFVLAELGLSNRAA